MSKIFKTEVATPTKFGLHAFHINLYLHIFFEPILFLTLVDYSPWSEGKFGQILKVALSQKLERPRPSKLVYIHYTSTSIDMNFLSRFYLIYFLTPMDYNSDPSLWPSLACTAHYYDESIN